MGREPVHGRAVNCHRAFFAERDNHTTPRFGQQHRRSLFGRHPAGQHVGLDFVWDDVVHWRGEPLKAVLNRGRVEQYQGSMLARKLRGTPRRCRRDLELKHQDVGRGNLLLCGADVIRRHTHVGPRRGDDAVLSACVDYR